MLQLTRSNETTFTLVSDDEHGENGALQDAIAQAAPHLLDAFDATEVDDDGLLRFGFDKEDWPSLLEALEALDQSGVVDPDIIEAMGQTIEEAST